MRRLTPDAVEERKALAIPKVKEFFTKVLTSKEHFKYDNTSVVYISDDTDPNTKFIYMSYNTHGVISNIIPPSLNYVGFKTNDKVYLTFDALAANSDVSNYKGYNIDMDSVIGLVENVDIISPYYINKMYIDYLKENYKSYKLSKYKSEEDRGQILSGLCEAIRLNLTYNDNSDFDINSYYLYELPMSAGIEILRCKLTIKEFVNKVLNDKSESYTSLRKKTLFILGLLHNLDNIKIPTSVQQFIKYVNIYNAQTAKVLFEKNGKEYTTNIYIFGLRNAFIKYIVDKNYPEYKTITNVSPVMYSRYGMSTGIFAVHDFVKRYDYHELQAEINYEDNFTINDVKQITYKNKVIFTADKTSRGKSKSDVKSPAKIKSSTTVKDK